MLRREVRYKGTLSADPKLRPSRLFDG